MDDLVTWLRGVLDEDERNSQFESGDPYLDARAALMLADVAAKRAILDEYSGDGEISDLSGDEIKGLGIAVRLVAWAYRDRDGYRDEWRSTDSASA